MSDTISTVIILQQQIFILHINLLEKIPNSEIITTQIGQDTENSEKLTYQIISSLQDLFQWFVKLETLL